ncbi:MAG: helicase, partial [Prevotellaceae bacterium]|nr:helicase [Prevotellaceae bacterium]
NPAKKGKKAEIHYHDIGDYLSREQKLSKIKDFRSIASSKIEWKTITPNKKADWINQRDGVFDSLIPLTAKDDSVNKVFTKNVTGLLTSRDAWDYNFGKGTLEANIRRTIDFYNEQREIYKTAIVRNSEIKIEDFAKGNEDKISWTVNLKKSVESNMPISYNAAAPTETAYRPFVKMMLYNDKNLVERPSSWGNTIVNTATENKVICVSGVGVTKSFSCLMLSNIIDYDLIGKSQCFPLYWYEENKNLPKSLFDDATNKHIRRDGISNWILKEVQQRYHTKNITKEHIFYYVYGLLHSEDYRTRFADDLKKSLPRIPIVESIDDFMNFYKWGKALANLHLHYEREEPNKEVVVSGLENAPDGDCEEAYNYFYVTDKLRFKSKDDKSTIIYNSHIVLRNIPPKAYEYIVNGKSAIEWIVERYCVSIDKKSLIKNDCNDWAKEHHQPRYILDLLLSVVNVSVKTVDMVKLLPRLKFD